MRYLIVRPDGLIPAYPIFVLDGHDPAAHPAMIKYMHAAAGLGYSNLGELHHIANKMKQFAGTTPPPIIRTDEWIAKAIKIPGGRVKLYELDSTPHA